MKTRLLPYLLLLCFFSVCAFLFQPLVNRSPHNARRASCQSNLKQIGLALRQYSQDYDEKLPLRDWVTPVVFYAKSDMVFQCSETTITKGNNDYFFNSRFVEAATVTIASPKTLVLIGDGQDDGGLNATLAQLPSSWRADEKSPAWRHLDGANYGFADGHVKWMKVNRVNRDFRMVGK
ncbi:DUF1559 domain-containing protein [bacterium]|nr:MAG: DUF1559 domain-containing protein [bacterium]